MELLIIISSVLRRYEFVLADPDKVVCSFRAIPLTRANFNDLV
jgi:hypothetical protein